MRLAYRRGGLRTSEAEAVAGKKSLIYSNKAGKVLQTYEQHDVYGKSQKAAGRLDDRVELLDGHEPHEFRRPAVAEQGLRAQNQVS